MNKLPAIDIQDISVRFRTPDGPLLALEHISAHISSRSVPAPVVGPFRLRQRRRFEVLSSVSLAERGRVCFDGRPLKEAAMTGHIGYVFQRPMLLPWRTALGNVMLTMEVTRKEMSQREREGEARRWLDIVGLRGFEERRPHELPAACNSAYPLPARLYSSPGSC